MLPQRRPTPIAQANEPISYGTTPKENRTMASLKLLGMNQPFPSQNTQPQGLPNVES